MKEEEEAEGEEEKKELLNFRSYPYSVKSIQESHLYENNVWLFFFFTTLKHMTC